MILTLLSQDTGHTTMYRRNAMNIKEMIFELVGCGYCGEVQEIDAEGIYVKYGSGKAVVGGSTIPAKCRAYTLLAKALSEGKEEFEISQKPSFETCGPMIDMSRGGVMKVESVKTYLRYAAAFGMNMIMLYTEDTYEVESYPYMGYQRGRYTLEELREVDDYAASLGIEVIPCIQTLGHMEQFLRHAGNLMDNKNVLLAGVERTYEFIEACILTMRKAFRSNRIHIGCDETKGLGTGNYLKLNGYRDPFDVFSRHVARIVEICRKYDFHPMMWSDMYFTLTMAGESDFDPNVEIPQRVVDGMPDADMVFWDYYHTNNDFYRGNIEKHNAFHRKMLFAGGIWTWDGFVPNYSYTYDTMKPAMEECLKGGVREVIATLWSNDGCECSHMLGIPMLSLFSEYCWRGLACTEDDIWQMSEFVTGLAKELAYAVSDFFFRYEGSVRAGKLILWSDPLINLLCYDFDFEAGIECLTGGLKIFEKYSGTEYFKAVFRAALDKCRLHKDFRNKYKAGDREWLAKFAEHDIPEMIKDFENLYQAHYDSWYRDYKTQGFERIMHDYAGAIERLRYTKKVVEQYLAGDRETIEELEPELIQGSRKYWLSQKETMYSYMIYFP